ncbi:hypothetical protein GCM10027055_12290 [Janibacter alkaliphilus]|uniref:DUF4185 domain-containing protein n=1 Tax=Janibacter alkaliphilus TaxID=1069963 RepID=A0A852X4F3_9MICO|nr:hypothetical protein [Janibacter alkaliphilus]
MTGTTRTTTPRTATPRTTTPRTTTRRTTGRAPGRTGAAAAATVLGLGLLAGCGGDSGADGSAGGATCDVGQRTIRPASAAPEENVRFETRGPGWIAGDSAYSVALPDGRTLWLFSDSFVGTVDRWDAPAQDTAMVHNALVLERDDGTLDTRTSTRDGRPHAFFPDPSDQDYYWVQDGVVDGDELVVTLARTQALPDQGFAWTGSAIARVSLPDLELLEIAATPADRGIAWGAGLLQEEGTTFVYGVRDDGATGRSLHLARVPAGALTDRDRWRYWDGSGWADQESAAATITTGVANELSVSPVEDGYVLISQQGDGIFSPEIRAWTACSPTGPWGEPSTVYETPESGRGRHVSYNAHAHPQLSDDGELLVSYNVNTFDFGELVANPTLYRPRFVAVPTD